SLASAPTRRSSDLSARPSTKRSPALRRQDEPQDRNIMTVATLGTLSLLVLFAIGLVSIALAMLGAHRKSARLVEAAVQGVYATAAVSAFASSLIIYAFLADDFSIQYVHHTSDSAMPLFYKITAFWGGLDGSMLFWVLLLS